MDSEFTGLTKDATLISLGLVADTGATFYSEFTDYDETQVNEWIQENVISNLLFRDYSVVLPKANLDHVRVKGTREAIVPILTEWLNQFQDIQIWADVCAYDWVLFCDLFGGAMQLPSNIYYIPFDISTLLLARGYNPDIQRELLIDQPQEGKHNALYDARITKSCYEFITQSHHEEEE